MLFTLGLNVVWSEAEVLFCLEGGLGGSVYSCLLGIPILLSWESEGSVRPGKKVSFIVIVYPKELM